jgi:hypothetical protein
MTLVGGLFCIVSRTTFALRFDVADFANDLVSVNERRAAIRKGALVTR